MSPSEIITILGFLGTIWRVGSDLVAARPAAATEAQSRGGSNVANPLADHDLIPLSLATAIIALILVDAILPPGRTTEIQLDHAIRSGLWSALVPVLMFLGYRTRRHFAVMLLLSLTTLCARLAVLFQATPAPGVNGPSWVSILVQCAIIQSLVFWCATRLWGEPSVITESGRRVAVGLTLATIASTAIAAHRFDWVVSQDARMPAPITNLSGAAQQLAKTLSVLAEGEVSRLYQMGTEISLSTTYQRRASSVGPRLDRETVRIDTLFSIGRSETKEVFQNPLEWIPRQNSTRRPLDRLVRLERRLPWVHPVPPARIPLMGLDPTARWEGFADSRIIAAMELDKSLQQFLAFPGMRYGTAVRTQFADGQSSPETMFSSMMNTFFGRPSRLPISVFASESNDYQVGELTQLALPAGDEAALALVEYASVAPFLAIQNLGATDSKGRAFWPPIFDDLPSRHKLALVALVGGKNAATSDLRAQRVVKMLGAIAETAIPLLAEVPRGRRGRFLYDAATQAVSSDNTAPGGQSYGRLVAQIRAIASRQVDSAAAREDIREVLDAAVTNDDEFTVFDEPCLRAVRELASQSDQHRQAIVSSLRQPVAFFWGNLRSPEHSHRHRFATEFASLSASEQRAILHHLALSLYGPSELYSLPWPMQLVSRAASVGPLYGTLAAFVLFVGPMVLAGVLGVLLERWTQRREQSRQDYACGDQRPDDVLPPDQWALAGRSEEMRRIGHLLDGSRFVVALTGRRGIGKTRVMRELFRTVAGESRVGVWIDCPSRYEQVELLWSMMERVALSLDTAVSKYLGVASLQRLQAMKLELRVTENVSIVLALMLLIAWVSMSVDRGGPPTTATALVAASMALVSVLLWLLARSSVSAEVSIKELLRNGPALLKLHQRTRQVLNAVQNRIAGASNERASTGVAAVRFSALVLLGFYVLYLMVAVLFHKGPDSGLFGQMLQGLLPARTALIAEAFVMFLFWLGLYRFKAFSSGWRAPVGPLALTDEYRRYVREMATALKEGALGPTFKGLMICIDELDKIPDPEDLRDFVRTIKPLLDIEGCVYLLSLSEDAVRAVQLGPVKGKDIFDSAIEHTERLEPLSMDALEQLIKTYSAEVLGQSIAESNSRAIALLSFGVARDAIRLTRTLHAFGLSLSDPAPRALLSQQRAAKVGVAHEAGLVGGSDAEILSLGEPSNVAEFVRANQGSLRPDALRLAAFAALVAFAEANTEPDKMDRSELWAKLLMYGHRLPLIPIKDLRHLAIADIPSIAGIRTCVART